MVRAVLPEGMGFPGLPGAARPASALGSGRVEAMGLSSHAAEGRWEMPAGRCCPHWTSPPHRPVWRGSARQGSEGQRAPCPLSGGRSPVPLARPLARPLFLLTAVRAALLAGRGDGEGRRTAPAPGSFTDVRPSLARPFLPAASGPGAHMGKK